VTRSPRRLQQEHPNIISSLLLDRCPDGISQPPPAVVVIFFTVLGPSRLVSRVFRQLGVTLLCICPRWLPDSPSTPVSIRYQVPAWNPVLALTVPSHIDASRRGAVVSGHRCSASQEPNCRTVAQAAVTDLRCIPTDRHEFRNPAKRRHPSRRPRNRQPTRTSQCQQLDWAAHRNQRKQENSLLGE
jgi:hypothetical protein